VDHGEIAFVWIGSQGVAMIEAKLLAWLGTATLVALHAAFAARAILRPHRQPASRLAWVLVLVTLPALGIAAYVLFGEVSIGRRSSQRRRNTVEALPLVFAEVGDVPDRDAHLFRAGHSISGFEPVHGNRGTLFSDSNEYVDSMIDDIDAAREHVHLLVYIWLDDRNGLRIADALKRAASRGVRCRAIADGLGSRALIASEHWEAMRAAGVRLGVALPIGNPLLRIFKGRIDLRNHRKILVIDDRITYCGSQNCADPEFRIKPKFAPWVDAVIRFEGPVARQNQHLFVADWMSAVDEDLTDLLRRPAEDVPGGFVAQAFGTGPTVRNSAMPEMFETLMYSARRRMTITTPYFVPNESMQSGLCAAARRGVETTIVFPARNDSRVVAAASRSYYEELLDAGVHIQEIVGGLLHAKTFTVDDDVTLIGSANMDRRSFDLNYENNILLVDMAMTEAVMRLQDDYIARSIEVTAADVSQWPLTRRLWNNAVGMMGPIL
jgi:cardiolipin synthase